MATILTAHWEKSTDSLGREQYKLKGLGGYGATVLNEGKEGEPSLWNWQIREGGHCGAHGWGYDGGTARSWAVSNLKSQFSLEFKVLEKIREAK